MGCANSTAVQQQEGKPPAAKPPAAPPPPPPVAGSATPAECSGRNALAIFSGADVDDSGTLTVKELTTALTKEGTTEEDCAMLFKICDANRDGEVSMIEFSRGMKKWESGYRLGDTNVPPPPPALQVSSAGPAAGGDNALRQFAAADVDDSGTLTMEELQAELTKDGTMGAAECAALFELCDANADGELSMIEFARGLKKWNAGERSEQPEADSEVEPEAEPEAQPEAEPEAQPTVEPEAQPEGELEAQPEAE